MECRDKKEIRNLFERFVTAWESCRTQDLRELLLENCDLDFSIFRKGISRETLAEQLAVRTRKPTYTRFEIYNFVCCIGEGVAQQSATVCGLFVDESGERPANFGFTAKMANSLVKTENGWRYSAMQLELAGESDNHGRLYTTGVGISYMNGDTSFVQNWRLIPNEVGWHKGSRLPSVIPEEDAPWYAVPDRRDENDDQEQIRETLYRYCFALDFDCVELYDGVFSKDALLVYGDTRKYDKRSVTAMLRFEREGGIGSHHVLYLDRLEIRGDRAKACVYRAGMDYVPSEKLFGESKKKNYPSGRYDMEFIREDGGWRILKLHYYQGGIEAPWSAEVFTCSSGQ